MRVSREVATKNRQKVVRIASEQFRKHGYDGIGIASLMKAAGLTQGGFYKQFENKEALEVEASEYALQENFKTWSKSLENADDPIAALTSWYLSPEHLSAVSKGCVYASLGAETTRARAPLQQAFTMAIEQQIELLATAMEDDADVREKAIATMAQLIGTLVLARSVDRDDLQQEILAAGRNVTSRNP